MSNLKELRAAWNKYAANAAVTDGHTMDCYFRAGGDCGCGFSAVERSIRNVLGSDEAYRFASRPLGAA